MMHILRLLQWGDLDPVATPRVHFNEPLLYNLSLVIPIAHEDTFQKTRKEVLMLLKLKCCVRYGTMVLCVHVQMEPSSEDSAYNTPYGSDEFQLVPARAAVQHPHMHLQGREGGKNRVE